MKAPRESRTSGVGPGQRSWFSVLTRRIAASGDENARPVYRALLPVRMLEIELYPISLSPAVGDLGSRLNVGYIYDFFLQRDTIHECQSNVTDTRCLFTRYGYIIHSVKSVHRHLFFWVFVLYFVSITVSLPVEKVLAIKEQCLGVISCVSLHLSIHDISIQDYTQHPFSQRKRLFLMPDNDVCLQSLADTRSLDHMFLRFSSVIAFRKTGGHMRRNSNQ